MHIYGHVGCRRSCVLPFGGDPSGIAGLRRLVRDQLKIWGVLDLADQAQLAVSELAGNVIKHVGEGSPTTLVLELDDEDCLCLELHDTSPVLPTLRHPTSNDESGRGLALLSALSADWGSAPTVTGKVVWCRLAPGPLGVPATRTRERIQRATAALEAYGRTTGGGADLLARSAPIREELATILIADLLHWLAVQGVGTDPDEILDRAQTHFEAVSEKA